MHAANRALRPWDDRRDERVKSRILGSRNGYAASFFGSPRTLWCRRPACILDPQYLVQPGRPHHNSPKTWRRAVFTKTNFQYYLRPRSNSRIEKFGEKAARCDIPPSLAAMRQDSLTDKWGLARSAATCLSPFARQAGQAPAGPERFPGRTGRKKILPNTLAAGG
jgi:hypothetical protein